MDFVLVELPIDTFQYARARFSAFVEAPFDALSGVEPDDWLPIQGVAYDQAGRAEYVLNPCIAFPWYDEPIIATVHENIRTFSLLVDLTSFGANDVVRIGLYGYVLTYNLTGILTDGDFFGTPELSDFYGSVNLDDSAITNPQTPEQWTGLVAEDVVHMSPTFANDDAFDLLKSLFPELDGKTYVSGGFGGGEVSVFFGWDHTNSLWAGDPTLSLPDTDPDAFMISGAAVDISTFWASTVNKTVQTVGMTAEYLLDGGGPVPASSVTTPPDPPDNGQGVTVAYRDTKGYYVPSVRFDDDRPAPVNVASTTGVNLWTQQSETDTARPDYSLIWQTDDYPDRPEMAEIAVATVFNTDAPVGDVVPSNHFGQIRIGTLTLNRAAGTVAFAPADDEPTDGTPDGDGAIGDGTAPGRTANPQLRVWTYTLDGHDYYVLRLGDSLTLVYDIYSEQWMDWTDFNSLTWRAHIGINWTGAEALADTYGSNVLVGDDAYGRLWFLDPNQPYDDNPLEGAPTYFARVTVGQVPMRGREVLPCYATWLTTDMGDPAYSGAAVTLWSSDDAGETWNNEGFIQITSGEYKPELFWGSLGQIEAPGRIFKIFDDGAITRIDGLEMNDPDDK